MRFYLGTHMVNWLADPRLVGVPLFLSAPRLRSRLPRKPKPAVTDWALDSGGFTELTMHGRWTIPAAQYASEVRRWQQLGRLQWAAIQDWMCEPVVREGSGKIPGTRLSVSEHQRRTVASLRELRTLAPDLPWVPVVQGWDLWEYVSHVEQYARAGFDLTREPLVGVGSVCRRQGTAEATQIFRILHKLGVRCHGFGVKTTGFRLHSQYLASADSLAWSFCGRKRPIPEHKAAHVTCANCLEYALKWRDHALECVAS